MRSITTSTPTKRASPDRPGSSGRLSGWLVLAWTIWDWIRRDIGLSTPLGSGLRWPLTLMLRLLLLLAVTTLAMVAVKLVYPVGAAIVGSVADPLEDVGGDAFDAARGKGVGADTQLMVILGLAALVWTALVLLVRFDIPLRVRVAMIPAATWLGRTRHGVQLLARALLPVLLALGLLALLQPAPPVQGTRFGGDVTAAWNWLPTAAAGALLMSVFVWALSARKRIVVQEFDAFRDAGKGVPAGTDTESSRFAAGLSTMLVVELARLAHLYEAIAEASAKFRDAGKPLPRLQTGEGPLLSSTAVNTNVTVGRISFPLPAVERLIQRIARGPRLSGSVHLEGTRLQLIAQLEGPRAKSWKVDMEGDEGDDVARLQAKAVQELALRMHADLMLEHACNFECAKAFTEGLEAYRDSAKTPELRATGFRRAEQQFLAAVAADDSFSLAYYNLGAIYAAQGRDMAAIDAFQAAIRRGPHDWRAHYALGLTSMLDGREVMQPPRRLYRLVATGLARSDADSRLRCEANWLLGNALIPGHADTGADSGALHVAVTDAGQRAALRDFERTEAEQRRAAILFTEAERQSRMVLSRHARREMSGVRGFYLEGVALHYQAVVTAAQPNGNRAARVLVLRATRSHDRAARMALRRLRREALRRGAYDSWHRDVATDILAALGEAYGLRFQLLRDAGRLNRLYRWLTYRRARACFRQAFHLDPHDAGLRRRWADVALRSGRIPAAIREFEFATLGAPTKASYRQRLVDANRQNVDRLSASIVRSRGARRVTGLVGRRVVQPHRQNVRYRRRTALKTSTDAMRDETLRLLQFAADVWPRSLDRLAVSLALGPGDPNVRAPEVLAVLDLADRRERVRRGVAVMPPPGEQAIRRQLTATSPARVFLAACHVLDRANEALGGTSAEEAARAGALVTLALRELDVAFESVRRATRDRDDDENALHENRSDLAADLVAALAQLELRSGRAHDGLTRSRRLVERLRPLHGGAREVIGDLHARRNDHEAAGVAWSAAIALGRSSPRLRHQVVETDWRLAEEITQTDKRLSALDDINVRLKALLDDTDDPELRGVLQYQIGALLYRLGRYAPASRYADGAETTGSTRIAADLVSGAALVRAGRRAASEGAFERALRHLDENLWNGPAPWPDQDLGREEAQALATIGAALARAGAVARAGAPRRDRDVTRVRSLMKLPSVRNSVLCRALYDEFEALHHHRKGGDDSLADAIDWLTASVSVAPASSVLLELAERELELLAVTASPERRARIGADVRRHVRESRLVDLSHADEERRRLLLADLASLLTTEPVPAGGNGVESSRR